MRPDSGEVLSLSPLYVWIRTMPTDSWLTCQVFDGVGRGGEMTYKNSASAANLKLEGSDFEELRSILELLMRDQCGKEPVGGCNSPNAEGVAE